MPIASPMVSDAFSSCSCSRVNHLYTHFIAFTRSQSRHASSDVPDHPFIQEMMLARVSVCSTSDHDRYELVVVRNYRLNLKYCVEDRHRNTCIVHLSTISVNTTHNSGPPASFPVSNLLEYLSRAARATVLFFSVFTCLSRLAAQHI